MRRLVAVLGALVLLLIPAPALATCELFQITGYSHTGNLTASGQSTAGRAWSIAASHPRFAFGTQVWIQGIGTVTIQDRGLLAANHLDVLVNTTAEAYAITGRREVCW